MTELHQAETAKADQKFINEAVCDGLLEIQASRLALSQANLPPNVVSVAHAMINDHISANDRLSRIASAKGFSVPSALSKRGIDKLTKLQKTQGKNPDFLKAYDTFLVKTHRSAISQFEHEAKDSKDPDLKAFATDTLPTLHAHASMIDSLPYAKEEHGWWKVW